MGYDSKYKAGPVRRAFTEFARHPGVFIAPCRVIDGFYRDLRRPPLKGGTIPRKLRRGGRNPP